MDRTEIRAALVGSPIVVKVKDRLVLGGDCVQCVKVTSSDYKSRENYLEPNFDFELGALFPSASKST